MSDFPTAKSAAEVNADSKAKMHAAQQALDGEAAKRKAEARPTAPEDLYEEHVGPIEDEDEDEDVTLAEAAGDWASVKVSEEEKTAFFEATIARMPYGEEFEMFDGRITVLFRSRLAGESEEALLDTGKQDARSVVDYEAILLVRNLGWSLVHMKTDRGKEDFYDEGTLAERVARIHKIPTPLYVSLIDLVGQFDRKVARLSYLATQPNFWLPVSDTSS
jgi:hypothetical protein